MYCHCVVDKKVSTDCGLDKDVLEMTAKLCVKSAQFILHKNCVQYELCVHIGPQMYRVNRLRGILVPFGAMPSLCQMFNCNYSEQVVPSLNLISILIPSVFCYKFLTVHFYTNMKNLQSYNGMACHHLASVVTWFHSTTYNMS